MSSFLFPAGKHARKSLTARVKPTHIPKQLFQLVRGATDAVEALNLFLGLLNEFETGTTTPETLDAPGFLAFDAHVGDTACQLRACMLLEIVTQYRHAAPSSLSILQIQSTICRLDRVIANAQRFCQELLKLEWNKAPVKGLGSLGVSKYGMTMEEILERLGWKGPCSLSVVGQPPSDTSTNTTPVSSPSEHISEKISSLTPPNVISYGFPVTSNITDYPGLDLSDVTSDLWEPMNGRQTVQFLVYSYVLSKYKQFIVRAQVYGATIDPKIAFEASHTLMNGEFNHPYQRLKIKSIEEEFRVLQSYLSDLSSWLNSVAIEFFPCRFPMTTLLKDSTRTSTKGITAIPSYIGYLAIRELWTQTATPILIVSRRFCKQGFHANVFKATLRVSDNSGPNTTIPFIRPNISWDLNHMCGIDLAHLHKSLSPHIVICGNSLDGDTADYLDRLPNARPHEDEGCCDNIQHCKNLLESDQDEVVLSIFVDHRHYSFELDGNEGQIGEELVVQQIMDEITPGLSYQWRKSKEKAEALGTGNSLKLFMWQHVSLESPARFLQLLDELNRPKLISAPVLRLGDETWGQKQE